MLNCRRLRCADWRIDEEYYNKCKSNFNRMEFHTVRNESGRLVMTPTRWIEKMNAIGITSKAGKYGGTYAHTDIAFEFASRISPEFNLYLIKDYQRLKKDESEKLSIGWDIKRELSKINYTKLIVPYIPNLSDGTQTYAQWRAAQGYSYY